MNWTEYKNKINSDIKIVDRYDDNGFKYQAFENYPEELEITDKDRGNKLWIASQSRTTKCHLHRISDEGVHVKFKGEVPIRVFYPDEILVHPDHWSKKRLNFKLELKTRFS